MSLGRKVFKSKVLRFQRTKNRTYTEYDLFIATVSKESHRAFLLNSQLFTILHLEDQEEAEALTSKQGKPSADTAYPLSQILSVVGAGRSTFAFMIPRSTHTTNSLPGPFHFGRGRVTWHRVPPEAPCHQTLARKPFVTKYRA